MLALADARLRANNAAAAGRLFRVVLARDSGEPWTAYANLGLGGLAFKRGDSASARNFYTRAASSGDSTAAPAHLMLALLEADAGDAAMAEAHFDAVVSNPRATAGLRGAARLGVAYTRYWAGNYVGAVEAFDTAAAAITDGRLADDALYGRAQARLRAGDEPAARALLEPLAASRSSQSDAGDHVSRALQDLERRAVLRTGFDQYRKGALRAPEDGLVALLDLDGVALAQAALQVRRAPRPADAMPTQPVAVLPVDAPVVARVDHASETAVEAPPLPGIDDGSRSVLDVLLMLAGLSLLVVGGLTFWRTRSDPNFPGPVRRGRR
ncbi:MAG TPA: hypothetical protein VGR62_01790 [Candidatus Binatia bacterium]|nr:hypothetical protein [Candidatus Binatia bacterium]